MEYDFLYDVPAWTEDDPGCQDWDYGWLGDRWCDTPDDPNIGEGADSWEKWDGCAPIAGSMIVAYDTGHTDSLSKEYFIDKLHLSMDTRDDGNTLPGNMGDGFEEIGVLGYGPWEASVQNFWTDNHLKNQTNNGRPLLINMLHGGEGPDDSEDDGTDTYGDHTCTVVGYLDTGWWKNIILHNTWDDGSHYFDWGNWWASSLVRTWYHG